LHGIDEEGDVQLHLLAACMAIALFCRVVQQRSCQNAVKFPWP
jgi:hypothetical protein